MTRILLARHGETDWNAVQRVQGWTDIPLNDRGKSQAACLSRRLSSISLHAVYSSDLSRAEDTARLIAHAHDIPVATDTGLRERGYGDWEGLTPPELNARFPAEWELYHRQRRLDAPISGGETWADVSTRILPCLRRILTDFPGPDDTVLVVGHGGSLRLLILDALDAPLPVLLHLHLDNASLSFLTYRAANEGRVLLLNDTSHLGGAG